MSERTMKEIEDLSPSLSQETLPEGEEPPPPGVRIASIARWALLAAALLGVGFSVSLSFGWLGGVGQATAGYHCPMHPTVVSDRPGECPICGMDLVPIDEGGGSAEAHAHHHHPHDHGDEDETIRAVAAELGAKPGQWVCPMVECKTVQDEPGRCDVCGMRLVQVPEPAVKESHSVEAETASYTCPMHPEIEREGPGKCPICGMYLERKGDRAAAPAHGHGDGVPGLSEVTIPAERLARIGVRTARVEYGSLQSEVRTVGVVAADEGKRQVVQARFSGWVEELLVDETGAWVEAGQPLLRIYSPELYQAQSEYLNALSWGGELRRAAEQRLRLLGMADPDLAELRRKRRAEEGMVLRSRAAGHVLRKDVVAGAYIEPGTVLFEIADLSRVWVLADVYEQDIARVKPGQAATFAAAARSGQRFLGLVSFVYPTVEPTTRTMRVRLEIPNEDGLLRPGMFGDVRLELAAPEGPIVPRDAVIDAGEHVYALVAKGGGRFRPREVHVLARGGDHLLVEGLEPGEEVVTSAAFFIDAESRLRAALSAMEGPPSHAGHDHGGGHD